MSVYKRIVNEDLSSIASFNKSNFAVFILKTIARSFSLPLSLFWWLPIYFKALIKTMVFSPLRIGAPEIQRRSSKYKIVGGWEEVASRRF